MKRPVGGYAFPVGPKTTVGMTTRDWFAGQALASGCWQAEIRRLGRDLENSQVLAVIARNCYAMADEMIKLKVESKD